MKTVVYADILIFINTLVNYFLLRADAALTGCEFKTKRILFSSFIGGLFSLIIYVDNIHLILNLLIKMSFMTIIIFAAFTINSAKSFIKHFASFLSVNLVFGGIMLAVNLFIFPEASIYNNGIVYFDIDILTLTASSAVCYGIFRLINIFLKQKTPTECIYPFRITYQGKTVEGKALYDSGNTLCDCFSGKPVIIAEKNFLINIINTDKIEETDKYRLIPYSTLKGNGVLPAFMVEGVSVYISNQWIEAAEVFIAVTDKKIISSDFSVLIGAPFFYTVTDKIKLGGKHEKIKHQR